MFQKVEKRKMLNSNFHFLELEVQGGGDRKLIGDKGESFSKFLIIYIIQDLKISNEARNFQNILV